MLLELPKQSVSPAKNIPWDSAKGRESKGYGGVYVNVF